MDRKYLAFDLETAKVQPPNLRDWALHRPLGICCAATYCEEATTPKLWFGRNRRKGPASQMTAVEARELVTYLHHQVSIGYTIVTWNGIGFDFDVLAEESGMHAKCKSLALGHVDMMFHVLCHLGFGVGLDAAARGMRLTRSCKRRTGSLMPKLWADENFEVVFRHVARDVRTTFALATACSERGYLRWITRWGTGRMIRLPEGWLIARVAQEIPEQIHTRGNRHWSRERLTAWMRTVG